MFIVSLPAARVASASTRSGRGLLALLASASLVALAAPALAQETASGPLDEDVLTNRETVIVTAQGLPGDAPVVAEARQRLSETPGAVAVVSSESYEERHAPYLADLLRDVPGVFAQKKWGGDMRLSIRGSGIGNANHNRGTFLAQDGVPFNEADGYGDFQLIDPSIARYTEVYKGGNSLRFGGALLGGAVNVITPTGRTAAHENLVRMEGGSYGTVRGTAQVARELGDWDVFAAASGFSTDGWRPQSEGQSQSGTTSIGKQFGDDREVRLIVGGGYIHQQIPGSITLSQALSNPQQANPGNVTLNYQRDMQSVRTALQTRWRLDASNVFEGGVYGSWKNLDHPIFQVIDQESRNFGAFGRMDWTGDIAGMKADAFYGLYYRKGDLDANQWVNLSGSKGDQRAKQRQNAEGVDAFAEGRLFVTPSFAVIAGGSYGWAKRDYQSIDLPGWAGDFARTEERDYDWLSPRLGLLWQNEAGQQVYANITKSVEPPNFGAYSPSAGNFSNVVPQEAWTGEIGTRGRAGDFIWDVSVYRAQLENELLMFTVNPGLGIPAATFNADETMHQGIEAGLDWQILDSLRLRQTWTLSDFRFEDDAQYGDNRLPVVPLSFYRAELRYDHPAGWFVAPGVEWSMTDTYADFSNTKSQRSPSYAIFNLGGGYRLNEDVSFFIELRNLTDEAYVSNATPVVTSTAATAGYFPGDGRSAYAGFSVGF